MNEEKPYRYKRDRGYSYTLGIYPTIEILNKRPDVIREVIIDPHSGDSDGIKLIVDLCGEKNIKWYEDSRFFKIVSPKENVYASAVFNYFSSPIKINENVIVLDNPQNMGNVGTIMRTMLGFGFKNLAIVRPGVDIFHPDLIRASMGALFSLKVEYFDTLEDYLKKVKNNIYLFSLTGKEQLSNIIFKQPYSLFFGNEGSGLDKSVDTLGTTVKIPMNKEVDSFNIAVSAGIVMYKSFLDI